MGKISPISIKYNIRARFLAEGVVEKPDVIGAVFGQTEGLLGEELELRELQKNGKIGRIDVILSTSTTESKTSGEIIIPAALDKTETTIIAAALETIERIGPCNAKITIEKIEDVRGNKREYVIERAKRLLEEMRLGGMESREIESAVSTAARTSQVIEYGDEQLPAGPDLDNPELVVVEGRADVLNLLKWGIKNVIAMNGTSVPATIKEFGKAKTLTLFIDGDRGGLLIAKDAIKTCQIGFVAQAPEGREVEELMGKEVMACLRSKISAEEFVATRLKRKRKKFEKEKSEADIKSEQAMFQKIFSEITGTRQACLLDAGLRTKKIPMTELLNILQRRRDIYAIIIDGTATSTIIRAAERAGCRHIVAKNFAAEASKVNLISL